MNWNGEPSRSVSADALTEAVRDEEREASRPLPRMVTMADELTAASDSELPTAIGRAMNGGGGGLDARRALVVGQMIWKGAIHLRILHIYLWKGALANEVGVDVM